MFKKKYYRYECIIPEVFNNENTEHLDDSLYKGDLFKHAIELNDFFVKFVSSLKEQEKFLYKYFKTQRFSLNQELISDIEKKVDELDQKHTELSDFHYKLNDEFINHVKNKYS